LKLLIFVVGPLIWAPFSEVLGRRILFIITYLALTAFNAAAAGSQNIWTLIILRFFAGAFGSSPLTNVSHLLVEFHLFFIRVRHGLFSLLIPIGTLDEFLKV
jgi:MFS family permease